MWPPKKVIGICRILLQALADLNSVNEDGNSSLYHVVLFAHLEIAKLLLEYGGDLKFENDDQYKVLDFVQDDNPDIQILLFKYGATPKEGVFHESLNQMAVNLGYLEESSDGL